MASRFPFFASKTPDPSTADGSAESEVDTDTRRPARVGLWVLLLGLGGFMLWAGLAPLDEGVPTSGMVTIDTKRKTVQHLSGGIVKEVLVREGQVVADGQVLVRLDEAAVKANYEAIRQRYLGLRATESRLRAERLGQDRIVFHPDLARQIQDPQVKLQMDTQNALFQSRRAGLTADMQVIEESIKGQESQVVAYEAMLSSRRRQLTLLQEELKNTRGLVEDGYAPRNRQFELERGVADIQSGISELTGSIARSRRTVAEFRQRAVVRREDFRKEVETQLAEIEREVESDAERLAAVTADLARVEIRSPTAGQVVGLAIQTVGGVVQPGQKLMDIVPEHEPLLLEARILPHLIDKVSVGLMTDVRFSTFSKSPQLVVQGQVKSVSSDLLSDPQTGMSYYLARIQVTPEGMQTLGPRQMQPGMPVEVVIKTGERTMLTYLMNPLVKRMAASMKEE